MRVNVSGNQSNGIKNEYILCSFIHKFSFFSADDTNFSEACTFMNNLHFKHRFLYFFARIVLPLLKQKFATFVFVFLFPFLEYYKTHGDMFEVSRVTPSGKRK